MKRAELLKDVIEYINRQKEISELESQISEDTSWNLYRDIKDELEEKQNSLENWLNEEV